jgi:chromosome partitioning protein
MYDSRNNLCKLVANDLVTHFKDDIFKSIIPRNVKLSECTSFGKPIILYDITSKGSEAYLSLAREIILKSEKKPETNNKHSSDQANLPPKTAIPKFEDYQV